jgi:2-dehydro-3-deoxygluconokinase
MVDVVTLGECMVLVYPTELVSLDESSRLVMDIAGAESNLCIGLSRLGHTARFISRVGNDPLGSLMRKILTREGVILDGLRIDSSAPTGVFFREHLPDGRRRVYYYRRGSAASHLGPGDLLWEHFCGARIVHITGITPALSESCAEACVKAIELAHRAGAVISFDPNYRAPLWDFSLARQALLPILAQADIVLMGHEDARALLDEEDELQSIKKAAQMGPKTVILKRAENGAWAWEGGRLHQVLAYPVKEVIDPVGAGDGFDAGFLAGWLRGYSVAECLRLGAHNGAAAVEVLGDYQGYLFSGDLT